MFAGLESKEVLEIVVSGIFLLLILLHRSGMINLGMVILGKKKESPPINPVAPIFINGEDTDYKKRKNCPLTSDLERIVTNCDSTHKALNQRLEEGDGNFEKLFNKVDGLSTNVAAMGGKLDILIGLRGGQSDGQKTDPAKEGG
jgi:hypothetical protein